MATTPIQYEPNINPRIIENAQGQALLNPSSQYQDNTPLDRDWVKIAFMTPSNSFTNNYDSVTRFFSTASMKFTSAVIGSSIEINPKPQFTRYADIRSKGIMPGRNPVTPSNVAGNYGMGRYYSEAIDDNAQRIYMRFGVAQFNSLVSFLLNASDITASSLARTGRISTMYKIGKAIGTIAAFITYPGVSAFIYLYRGLKALLGTPTSKYYTIKPTMHLYWSAVNTLVNTIAVNKGLFPMSFTNPESGAVNQPGQFFNVNAGVVDGSGNILPNTFLDQISRLLPGIIDKHGYFDVFAIAARPQAIANRLFDKVYSQEQGTAQIANSQGVKISDIQRNNPENPDLLARSVFNSKLVVQNTSLFDFIHRKVMTFKDYYMENPGKSGTESDPRAASTTSTNTQTQKVDNGPTLANTPGSNAPTETSFGDFLKSEFSDGASFAIFQVDYTGSISESFANATVESELSNTINQQASKSREARFNLSDGNLIGGAVGEVAGAAVGAVKDVAQGTLSGLTFGYSDAIMGALGILAGNGYIDVPKHWQSSSASLPRSTYNIELISPYGNVISQMVNIYIPLAMLLAGTLPLATGKQSYTSPFLVQLFDRGRVQVQTGMIESLSITRGTSNLGFTNLGAPLSMKVSFSVVDLSSIMSMPLGSGSLFNASNFSGDTLLNDYLAVLAGQDIYSQIYAMPRIQMNLAKSINSAKRFVSPAYWASLTHYQTTAGALSFFPVGTIARGIEGISRGSSLLNPVNGS